MPWLCYRLYGKELGSRPNARYLSGMFDWEPYYGWIAHDGFRWFDVSKQVVGSVLVHIANILLSMLSSGTFSTEPTLQSLDAAAPTFARLLRRQVEGDEPDFYHPNPCSFYLLNLAIDV